MTQISEHPFKTKLNSLKKKNNFISIIFKVETNVHYYTKILALRDDDFDCELCTLESDEGWCKSCFRYDDIFQIRWDWIQIKQKELEKTLKIGQNE